MATTPPRLPRLRERIEARPAPWVAALLAGLGFALYHGALSAGFTLWDDDLYVTRNPIIRDTSWAGIARLFTEFHVCNYHPLTWLTLMGEFALVGVSPWLYHLDNLLLHVTASWLVWALTRRLLPRRGVAVLTALLFLVHPLRVESVAWVAERKDVLCATLYLATLVVWLDAMDGRRVGWRGLPLALILFLAALLSKAMAITLPAVLVLLLAYRRRLERAWLLRTLPFWGLSLVFAVIAYRAQAAFGALQGTAAGSGTSPALSVPVALTVYARKLIAPWPLSARYVVTAAEGLTDPRVLAGLGLLAAALVAAAVSFGRRRVALLGVGFFLVTWSPVSGVVRTSTLVADRYMYLPALGLLWPALDALARVVEARCSTPARLRPRLAAGSATGILATLAAAWIFLACGRAHAWKDGVTLWRSALLENPESPYAHNQLAIEYLDRGRYREASHHASESIRHGLRAPEHLFNLCLAWRGLGDVAREAETARGILAASPDFLPARLVILRHLREAGDDAGSERLLRRLEAAHGSHPAILAAGGDLLAARGAWAPAFERYTASLRLRPADRETLAAAALAAAHLGRRDLSRQLVHHARNLPGGVPSPGARERLDAVRRVLGGPSSEAP